MSSKKTQYIVFLSSVSVLLHAASTIAHASSDDILACRRKADINDEDASNTSNVSILRSAIEELTHSKESTEGGKENSHWLM